MPYIRTFSGMRVTVAARLDPIGIGYHYAVLASSMAHTAFRTREGFEAWVKTHGLSVPDLPPQSETSSSHVEVLGIYRTASYLDDRARYDELVGPTIRVLDNARWTEGKITEERNGILTIHYLNCNVADRREFDYWESNALVDAGLNIPQVVVVNAS